MNEVLTLFLDFIGIENNEIEEFKIESDHIYCEYPDPRDIVSLKCLLFMTKVIMTDHNKSGMYVPFDSFEEGIWFCVFISDTNKAINFIKNYKH